MKKILTIFILCIGSLLVSAQYTTPRFGILKNQDNTGRVLTYDYQAPVYSASPVITCNAYETTVKMGTLTGAPTLTANVTQCHVGDKLNLLLTDDGSGRVVTFSTGFTSGGNITMGASQKASIYFVFNGVGWFQMSAQNLVTGLAGDGSAAAAGIGFTGQADLGLYKVSATELGFTAGGTKTAGLSTTGLTVTGFVSASTILKTGDGTVSLPGVTFISDPDCGLYRIGANNDGYALNGAKVLDIKTTGLEITGNLKTTTTIVTKRTGVAINADATATAANIMGGLITSTSGAATAITLPSVADLVTASGAAQGTTIDFVVDNSAGANTVTVAVGVGMTASGFPATNTLTVPASATVGIAGFRIAFMSGTAATLTRIF
jgi:hypothetical protein